MWNYFPKLRISVVDGLYVNICVHFNISVKYGKEKIIATFGTCHNVYDGRSTDICKCQLLDVQIFKDSPVVGWSGSGMGELETIGDTLGLPTLRLNVQTTVQSGWWISLLTLRGWNTHDLSQYVENGYLEFDIKGKEGGEDFVIGFKVYYVTVTTDWQHVKIPLRDLMKINNGFDPSSVRSVYSMVQ